MYKKIGIKIVKKRPDGLNRTKNALEHCSFVGKARDGDRFYAQNEDISCPLARYNLGLEEPSKKNLRALAKTLVGWGDAKTEDLGLKYLDSRRIFPYERKCILYFPFPDDEYEPDVIIEISTPSEIMAKVREITYITGESTSGLSSGVGAMCGECTAFPILTGKPNVSLGCTGSRPRVKLRHDEMFLALPYKFIGEEEF